MRLPWKVPVCDVLQPTIPEPLGEPDWQGFDPDIASASDYHGYGMAMTGRIYAAARYEYGNNTQLKSPELAEGHYTAEFWEYDSRIARRWEIDPVVKHWESGYACFHGNPILLTDWLGLDPPKRLGIFKRIENFLNRKDHVNKANKYAVENKIDEKDIKELSDGSIDVDNRTYRTAGNSRNKDGKASYDSEYEEVGQQKLFQKEGYDGSQPAFTKPVSNFLVRNVDTHEGGNANAAGKLILKGCATATVMVGGYFVAGGFAVGSGVTIESYLFGFHTSVGSGLASGAGDALWQIGQNTSKDGKVAWSNINITSLASNTVFSNPLIANGLGSFLALKGNLKWDGIGTKSFGEMANPMLDGAISGTLLSPLAPFGNRYPQLNGGSHFADEFIKSFYENVGAELIKTE